MVATKFWSSSTAIVLCSFSPPSLPAQGTWSNALTSGTPTLARHAAAYDIGRQRLVTFGGYDAGYVTQSSTWEFDGMHWAAIPATPPPARASHAMIFDVQRSRIVLFGGASSIWGSGMSDTWEFDGATWTRVFPAQSPAARFDHAMAYDMAAGSAVLFGGRTDPLNVFADTWRWDGTNWHLAAVTGPPARCRHAMSYDLNRTRTVMFGGMQSQALGDGWEWDGAAWHSIAAAIAPPPRSGHVMSYDISRMVTVLHGGVVFGSDTWEWDGTTWTQHGSTSNTKVDHVMVYDAHLQRITLHGGTTVNPIAFLNEVETYGHAIPGSYSPLGTSCAGSSTTPVMFTPPSVTNGPLIGQTSFVQVAPTAFHTFFVFGWSDVYEGALPLPFDLAAYGMSGCSLQVSRDAITSVMPANNTATLSVLTPNNPFLVGVQFFVQAFALDIGANPGGFTTTNRLMAVVGRN